MLFVLSPDVEVEKIKLLQGKLSSVSPSCPRFACLEERVTHKAGG